MVRSLGLIGQGRDPYLPTLASRDPAKAAAHLRVEEARRCREIRQVVVTSTNNVPVRVDNLVEGGPVLNPDGSISLRKLFQKPDGSSEWDPAEQWVDESVLNADGTPRDTDSRIATQLASSKCSLPVASRSATRLARGGVGLSRPLRSRTWTQLNDHEKRDVREQKGWSTPPDLDLLGRGPCHGCRSSAGTRRSRTERVVVRRTASVAKSARPAHRPWSALSPTT